MTKAFTIIAVTAIALAAALSGLTLWLGDTARRGHAAAYVRAGIASAEPIPGRPTIAWMGDSTIMYGGYPREVGGRLQRDPGARTLIAASWARNAYTHYCNLGDVLGSRPDLVVFIANLRRFETSGSSEQGLSACSRIPTSELPRAALLPFARQGITIPGLLLLRVLRWDFGRQLSERLDDTRWILRNISWFDLLRAPSIKEIVRVRNRELMEQRMEERRDGGDLETQNALAMWRTPLDPWHPAVQMLAAAVEMASRRGSQAIVLVAPVPHASLERRGIYDHTAVEQQISGIRRAVEPAGARLFDLHRILPESMMADDFGHLKKEAAQPMARYLAPILRRVLAQGIESLPLGPLDPSTLAEYAPAAVPPDEAPR